MWSEDLSTNPEPRVSEPVRDLKNELRSRRLELEPSEALRDLARPLASEPARLNEALMDLKSELFSARPDEEPREPFRLLARPLV